MVIDAILGRGQLTMFLAGLDWTFVSKGAKFGKVNFFFQSLPYRFIKMHETTFDLKFIDSD